MALQSAAGTFAAGAVTVSHICMKIERPQRLALVINPSVAHSFNLDPPPSCSADFLCFTRGFEMHVAAWVKIKWSKGQNCDHEGIFYHSLEWNKVRIWLPVYWCSTSKGDWKPINSNGPKAKLRWARITNLVTTDSQMSYKHGVTRAGQTVKKQFWKKERAAVLLKI